MNAPKDSPLSYLLIAIIIIPLLHIFLPISRIIPKPWNGLGIPLILVGVGINLAADSLLHGAGTTVKPFAESQVLVVDGVYRISRNPMYLGFVMILFGLAAMFGTLTPFLVPLIFVLLIDLRFVRAEQKKLERKFGEIYLGYEKYVRRWI